MAIALFAPIAPTIARSRAAVIKGSTRVVLRLVPELRVEAGEEIQIFMASLIALLVINTSLNQDAFVLQRLKHQMNTVNDQRDAILRAAAIKSSPVSLSASAKKLGMVANATPAFIELSGTQK